MHYLIILTRMTYDQALKDSKPLALYLCVSPIFGFQKNLCPISRHASGHLKHSIWSKNKENMISQSKGLFQLEKTPSKTHGC
jgi:hypothetical protein